MLVAHGSRDPAADTVMRELAAAAAAAEPGPDVRVCYLDVRGPTVGETVTELAAPGHPGAVVLPAFLAAGYRVRTDLPQRLRAAGADPERFPVTPVLGASPVLVGPAVDRLRAAGHRPGDAVVLAAAAALLEWALRRGHAEELFAVARPDNTPAIATARRLHALGR